MCAASLSVVVGDGAAVMLWTDNWALIGQLCKFAPSLYAATSRAGRKRVLRDVLADNQWARDVTGALTVQVVRDYLKVWELLRSVQLHPLQPDRFVWKWTADGSFSVSSAYRAFFVGSTKLLGAKELWRTKAPPKVKLFFWLALHRRLWTAERRKRHGLQDDDACALCDQHAETASHLFLGCAFARQVWFGVLQRLQLGDLTPTGHCDLGNWWIQQRKRIDTGSQPVFDSLFLLIS